MSGPITTQLWQWATDRLLDERNIHCGDLMKTASDDGNTGNLRAPLTGEIFKNPKLANVMDELADKGTDVFYNGWIAESITEAVHSFGGVMEKDDLKNAKVSFDDPVSLDYKGINKIAVTITYNRIQFGYRY